MSHQITLSDLEKSLFPERYPFYDQHFQEDLNYLKQEGEYDQIARANIRFKIRLVNLCLKVQNEDLRQALNYLFNKQVECFYNWQQSYNWFELKSILAFFLLFSEVKNFKELEKKVDKPENQRFLGKYLPKTMKIA